MVYETGHCMMQQLVEQYNLFEKVKEKADEAYRDAAIEESTLQVDLAEKAALAMQEIVKNLNNNENISVIDIDTTTTTDVVNDNNTDEQEYTAHCIASYFIEEARQKIDENTDSITTIHTTQLNHEYNFEYYHEKSSNTIAINNNNASNKNLNQKSLVVNNETSYDFSLTDSIPSIITTMT